MTANDRIEIKKIFEERRDYVVKQNNLIYMLIRERQRLGRCCSMKGQEPGKKSKSKKQKLLDEKEEEGVSFGFSAAPV